MTIPRRMDQGTGPRRALPDFTRSTSTIERMLRALDDGPQMSTVEREVPVGGSASGSGVVRVTSSRVAVRSALIRCAMAAVLLVLAFLPAILAATLLLSVPEGHAPPIEVVLLVAILVPGAVALALAALRFAVIALAAARSRLEVDDAGVTVVGAIRSRRVLWSEIASVDSRAVHPVHGVTAALRLRRGGRVVMPLYDRPVWTFSQPSDHTIRSLRAQLARTSRTAGGR